MAPMPACRLLCKPMPAVPKELDVHAGDLVEIDDHRYGIVPDRRGGLTLEPAATAITLEL